MTDKITDITEPQTEGEFIRLTYRMVKEMSTQVQGQDIRLREVETNQWKILGIACGLALVVSIIVSVWK